ncbi:hypothetical protein EMIT079MI2_600004 [Bacillus sp. IT-79MI2]
MKVQIVENIGGVHMSILKPCVSEYQTRVNSEHGETSPTK